MNVRCMQSCIVKWRSVSGREIRPPPYESIDLDLCTTFASGYTIAIISDRLGDRLPPVDFPLLVVAVSVTVKCLFKQYIYIYVHNIIIV